jgi:MFS family permease
MPALVRSLGASPLAVSWLLTAYLVAASVATPLIGRLGDVLGRGRVLTWVMLVFCVGSVICALGDSLAVLIAGRVLQGVAGGVFPLAYGIIRDTFPTATRMRAIGSLSVSLGVGAALGPAVAGIIVDHAGPSAIFWAGMLGALPALGAGRLLPELAGRSRAAIDWSGAAVLAGALAALLVLMTQGQQLGWTSSTALALLAAAAGLSGWWVTIESRRPAPLVDLRMLCGPTVALTNVAALCVGCGIFMAYVPLAPIAQAPASTGYGFGMSVAAAGALLIPHGAVQIVSGSWAGSLCGRVGSRATLLGGAGINTATIALIAAVHNSPGSLLLAGAVLGLGQALALTAMANLVVAAVPGHDVGIATGINMVMRTIGMALGSAVSAAILAGSTGSVFPSEHAYVVAFAVAACVTAGAVACALALPRLPRPDRGEPDVQPEARTRFSSGRTSRPIRSVLRSSRSIPTPRVPT